MFDDEPGNRAGPKRVTIRNETKDMEVEVANNNSGRGIRTPKRLENKKRMTDSMDETTKGDKGRGLRKRIKMVKKVKRGYNGSSVILIMSDCVLGVKADDATVEVVGGRHNLGEIW